MKRLVILSSLGWLALHGALPAEEKKNDSKNDVTIIGQIVPNDVRDKVRNHPCKIHTLTLAKDRIYVIDMQSKEFDTYLRVEDGAGKQLAMDDDGGDGLNSRLTFAPPKGDLYRIIATSFGGGAGMYTLSVRDAGPPPKAKP